MATHPNAARRRGPGAACGGYSGVALVARLHIDLARVSTCLCRHRCAD